MIGLPSSSSYGSCLSSRRAGLMIIGKLGKIVDLQAGIKAGLSSSPCWLSEMPRAVIAGVLSDKSAVLDDVCVFVFQAVLMFSCAVWTLTVRSLASVLIASITGQPFRLPFGYQRLLAEEFGVNYGCVFHCLGRGGLLGHADGGLDL